MSRRSPITFHVMKICSDLDPKIEEKRKEEKRRGSNHTGTSMIYYKRSMILYSFLSVFFFCLRPKTINLSDMNSPINVSRLNNHMIVYIVTASFSSSSQNIKMQPIQMMLRSSSWSPLNYPRTAGFSVDLPDR